MRISDLLNRCTAVVTFVGGIVLLIATGLTAGCASSGQSHGGTARVTIDSLAQQLEAEGLSVVRQGGGVQDRFSSAASAEFRVGRSGDVLEAYEFRRESTAELEANRIDASPNQPPFFYQDANLIVVHRGRDQAVTSALLRIFGRRVQ